jgi:DNA-binding HxlR family transcriptional regulator
MRSVAENTRGDAFDKNCPSRPLMDHLSSLWGVLVLVALLEGTMRFSELRRKINGVSEKMLAQTLRALERDGVVHREVRPVIPPHVDYSLTDLGTEAAKAMNAVYLLLDQRLPEFLAAQRAYDERTAAATR